MPANYNIYKEAGVTITEDSGCILSLAMPDKEEDITALGLL